MFALVECSCCDNNIEFLIPPTAEDIAHRGYCIWNGEYGDDEFYVTCPRCTRVAQHQSNTDCTWEQALSLSGAVLSSFMLAPSAKTPPHPNDIFFSTNE